jgi:LacI family transcriptional regulator
MSKNLEDIARLAGVSRSTVSRVINNQPNVSEATRQRVLDVVKREGYFPNPAARTLVTRRTQVLGLVIPQFATAVFADPYFSTLFQGVSRTVNQHDYAMMLWLGESLEEEGRFYNRIRHIGLIDGIIVASAVDDNPLVARLAQDNFPFALIGLPPNDQAITVDVDNVHAASMAVGHLISLGYQRIGTITGKRNMSASRLRLEGYCNALRAAGRDVDPDLIVDGNFLETSGYIGMTILLKRGADAVFCANDGMAAGAIRAIHEHGLHVPDDIAVVGFDDLPLATLIEPPLTTIRQPVKQLGSAAAEALINLLEGKLSTPYRAILPTELVIRDTCGALRRSV